MHLNSFAVRNEVIGSVVARESQPDQLMQAVAEKLVDTIAHELAHAVRVRHGKHFDAALTGFIDRATDEVQAAISQPRTTEFPISLRRDSVRAASSKPTDAPSREADQIARLKSYLPVFINCQHGTRVQELRGALGRLRDLGVDWRQAYQQALTGYRYRQQKYPGMLPDPPSEEEVSPE